MLEVTGLSASYGAAEVVRDVSLVVGPGEVVAVVGANGAGKTTLIRAIAGLHATRTGAVRAGEQLVPPGDAIGAARAGVALVPQGRRVFRSLTVAEHLAIASRHRRPVALSGDDLLAVFPRLAERLDVRARALSGGEQQMLAIARAVALGPSVLLLDEPTEGLAPGVIDVVGGLVSRLAGAGMAVLLAEQQPAFPRTVAGRIVEMYRGVLGDVEVLVPATAGARTEVAR